MKALVRHIIVVQTSSKAAHQDPRTVILMGAACAGACGGMSSPVYVTSLTFVGSQRALHNTSNVARHLNPLQRFAYARCVAEAHSVLLAHNAFRDLPRTREDGRLAWPFQTQPKAIGNGT